MRLFLLPSLLATSVLAAPYIVTTYVVLSVYTYDEGYTDLSTTIPKSVRTYTRAVAPISGVSALATISTNAAYADVTIVEVVVPTGKTLSYDDEENSATYLETDYLVAMTYAPLPTCTSQNWTWTTTIPVYVPDIVTLPAISTSLSVSTYSYGHYNPTPTTRAIALVNPTDVNVADLASARREYMPTGMSSCYTPTTYCPTSTLVSDAPPACTTTFVYDASNPKSQNNNDFYYGSSSSDDYSSSLDAWTLDIILISVLVPVGWFLIWLLIGLWESWMSFKGLMLGQHRKRGLPYAWCCISFLFLCWTGPTYKAKSAEEQAELAEKWKALKKREKFTLWLKWGFRWKYPDMLGEEPEFAKRAFRQGCL